MYFFRIRLAPVRIERAVEQREFLQRLDAGAHDERQRCELDASLQRFLLQLGPQVLELGDIGFVELGDMRDVDPTGMQARAGDLLDARQGLGLDRPE